MAKQIKYVLLDLSTNMPQVVLHFKILHSYCGCVAFGMYNKNTESGKGEGHAHNTQITIVYYSVAGAHLKCAHIRCAPNCNTPRAVKVSVVRFNDDGTCWQQTKQKT